MILSVSERVAVEAGEYEDVVLTGETTPLEPDVLEYKCYAPGVGVVLAIGRLAGFLARTASRRSTGL